MQFAPRAPRRSTLGVCLASFGLLALSGSVFAQEAVPPAESNESKPAAAPAAPAPAPPPITVNGQLELNYTFNFNEPFNGSNLYLYNTKEGQLAINLAEVKVSRLPTPASRTGFNIRLIEGEVKRVLQNTYAQGNFNPNEFGGVPNVLEAYGSFLVPVKGREMKVDAGLFVTHVGYETIDIGTNNFFSRNFLFQFPSPFYNGGVRAALPLGAKTTVTGLILNRYNGVNDTGNRDIAPGLQIAQTLSSTSSLVFNALYSRENLNPAGQVLGTNLITTGARDVQDQTVVDLIYTNQFNPGFKLVAEGLYRFGDGYTGKSYNLAGGAGYLIFPLKNGNILSLRGEYLGQSRAFGGQFLLPEDGINAATNDDDPNIGSATVSYELRSGIFPGMRTFLEYRYDFSNHRVFAGEDSGEFKKSQNTLTIGQVFAF